MSKPDAQLGDDRPVAPPRRHPDGRRPRDRDDEEPDGAEQHGLEHDQALGADEARATGPDSRVPTKLPAIAAAVHSGNRRFACRASKTEPAIVQAIVTADGADRVDAEPRERDGRRVTGGDEASLDASRISAIPSRTPVSSRIRGDPAERCAVGERRDESGESEPDEQVRQ